MSMSSELVASSAALLVPCRAMSTKSTGAWFFKAIPKEMMQRVKIAAAIEGRTVKDMVLELLEQHLKEMEKKGLLPKGK
jgi:hypothetical protein